MAMIEVLTDTVLESGAFQGLRQTYNARVTGKPRQEGSLITDIGDNDGMRHQIRDTL